MFAAAISAEYFAAPVTLRRPSTRSIGSPTDVFRIVNTSRHFGDGREGTHERALRELDLESIFSLRLRALHGHFGGDAKLRRRWTLALQRCLREGRSPWLRGHAAECDA